VETKTDQYNVPQGRPGALNFFSSFLWCPKGNPQKEREKKSSERMWFTLSSLIILSIRDFDGQNHDNIIEFSIKLAKYFAI